MDPVVQASTESNSAQLVADNVGVQPIAAQEQPFVNTEQGVNAVPIPASDPMPISTVGANVNPNNTTNQVTGNNQATNLQVQPQPNANDPIPSTANLSLINNQQMINTQGQGAQVETAPSLSQQISNVASNIGPVPQMPQPGAENNKSQQGNVSANSVSVPQSVQNQPINSVAGQPAIQIQNVPIVDQLQAQTTMQQNNVATQAPTASPQLAVNPTIMEQVNSGGFAAPTPSELELGTIGNSGLVGSVNPVVANEMIPGLVTGTDTNVVQQSKPESQAQQTNISGNVPGKKHPLYDLYEDLQKQAENSQLLIDQEIDAERQNKNLAEMKDEILGWQITGKVTNVLMIASWVLSLVSLFFPWLFNNSSKDEQGFSADFILFIVSIMILLTCTVLSFWIRAHSIIKIVTWAIFVLFVIIFILIALHSGGLINESVPLMNGFLNRFSF